MNTDNGILAAVGGQYVADGSKQLPDPATATAEELYATVDAGWVGTVRITYGRRLFRHRKLSLWYWRAISAQAISTGPSTPFARL